MDGDVAQLVEHQTGMPPIQVRFPGVARDFSPRVSFQCRLSYGVRTPLCTTACINICARVKDPLVRVRVWWIIETLKHPTGTLWQKSHWDSTVVKSKSKKPGKLDSGYHDVQESVWCEVLLNQGDRLPIKATGQIFRF